MRVVAFAAVIGESFNSARNLGQAVKEIRLGVDEDEIWWGWWGWNFRRKKVGKVIFWVVDHFQSE